MTHRMRVLTTALVALTLVPVSGAQGDDPYRTSYATECPGLVKTMLTVRILEVLRGGAVISSMCTQGRSLVEDYDGLIYAAVLPEYVSLERGQDVLARIYHPEQVTVVATSTDADGTWNIRGTPAWGGRTDLATIRHDNGTWSLILTESVRDW